MSMINISVDTKNQEVSIDVDGTAIENVRDVCIYTSDSGYFGVDIGVREELGDMKKIVRLVASEDADMDEKNKKGKNKKKDKQNQQYDPNMSKSKLIDLLQEMISESNQKWEYKGKSKHFEGFHVFTNIGENNVFASLLKDVY